MEFVSVNSIFHQGTLYEVKDAAALLAAAVADESDNEEQTSAKQAAGTPRDFESAAEGARRKSPYVSAGHPSFSSPVTFAIFDRVHVCICQRCSQISMHPATESTIIFSKTEALVNILSCSWLNWPHGRFLRW